LAFLFFFYFSPFVSPPLLYAFPLFFFFIFVLFFFTRRSA